MRQSLLSLINQTIIFEYSLPHAGKGISDVSVSTGTDECYSANDLESLKTIIYNSIIEYSFNEFELNSADYQALHARALQTKIHYKESANKDTKIKYGFFGEVLLYSLLHVIFKIQPLIARGYFYNPLEKSETKGYDSYHLLEKDKKIELWYGESKFHQDYKKGIDDVFGREDKKKKLSSGWKIEKALSDGYLNTNILAIISNHKNNLNIKNSTIEKIIASWEANPNIIIAEELKKYNAKLVYPILILYTGKFDYDENIKKAVEYINISYKSIVARLSVNYSVFFIFLPLSEVKQVKLDVIKWIELKKGLLL